MEFIDTNLNTLTDMFPFNDGSRPVLRQCTWIAVTFVSYVIGFNLLSKFAKAHLIHEALPKINQYRLKIALWRIVFALWAIVLYFACVWDSNEGNLLHVILQAAAPKCTATSLNVSKRNVYSELALFTAPVSFFLHQIYVSISSFTEPAVTSMGGLSLFVCLCNFIDCQKFCLHVLFLLGLNVGTLEVARTIYALRSRCKGFDGPPPSAFLRCMALPVFIIHLLTWMLINFYLFPKTYFSLPSATDIEPSARTATVYINLFIIIFAKVQFFDSPAWSLVKLVVKKPSALGRASGWKSLPMIVLLPYSSSLLPELKTIQLKFLMNALPTSAERRIIRRKIMSGESQTSAPISEGKANLLSFIKCVKILKRKMRHRYEQKTANETENMSQEEYEHKLMEEDLDENAAGSSQGQDVTDLFFSVPSLQDGMSAARHETSITDLGTSVDVDASSIRNETGSSKAISEAGSTPLKQNEEEKHRRLTESDKESQD